MIGISASPPQIVTSRILANFSCLNGAVPKAFFCPSYAVCLVSLLHSRFLDSQENRVIIPKKWDLYPIVRIRRSPVPITINRPTGIQGSHRNTRQPQNLHLWSEMNGILMNVPPSMGRAKGG